MPGGSLPIVEVLGELVVLMGDGRGGGLNVIGSSFLMLVCFSLQLLPARPLDNQPVANFSRAQLALPPFYGLRKAV